jgi:hypothetical protein
MMKRVVSYVYSVNPSANIGVSGILPRPKDWLKFNEGMLKARVYSNVALKIYCKSVGVEYFKTESCLLHQYPEIPIYRQDGLHLTDEGAVYVKKYLGGKIGELLGSVRSSKAKGVHHY